MNRVKMITAHNGCEGIPDHTLASIEKGIAVGADCVEIDIRSDDQGRLWLIHDRPADFSGLVQLEEAFALIRDSGIAVNCDLKEESVFLPTFALAEKMGLSADQLVFSGAVDPKLLDTHPDIAKHSRIFLNSEVLFKDLSKIDGVDDAEQKVFLFNHVQEAAKRFHALGAEALNTNYKHVPDELIAALKAQNIPLSLWTLNREEVLREFIVKDIYNITTRIPSVAIRLRNAADLPSD